MKKPKLGIIGGSGLYNIEGLEGVKKIKVRTPFGHASGEYIVGKIEGTEVVFLPRHGKGHVIMPHEINYRANIYGFKEMGVDRIVSVSAVGSMKEDIVPGQIVVIDQFYDNTKRRVSSFFGDGVVVHVPFAQPVCPDLRALVLNEAKAIGADVRDGGTYLCMEGPQFSSLGESTIYRKWGIDVIGMTNIPEAKLAREAEICYASLAIVTDYDCWRKSEESVSVEMVIKRLASMTDTAKSIIKRIAPKIEEKRECICAHALKDAIMTEGKYIPADTYSKLELLLKKYVKA